jgi:PAS domain S-box-containing protein
VFLDGAQGERFWGLVSAVIDSDRLFRDVGLSDPALPIEIAIRGADARGAAGLNFIGRAGLFEQDPVLAEIELPQGSWQLAAVPRGGWPGHADTLWSLRAAYAALALLVLGTFLVLTRALHAASTARVRAEAAQRQVVAVLEGAPDAMLLVDAAGSIVRVNPQAERLFGWSRTALEGRPVQQLLPGQADLARAALPPGNGDATRPGDPAPRLEVQGRRADGSLFPLEMSLSPVQIDERRLLAASIRDVSARKEVEAELERYRDQLESKVEQRTAQLAAAKEAAEAASVAKTVFLANMSHEIRTPLNAITGMAYLVRRAGVNAEQAARLDTLEAASRHLLQVINAILDLSKIESGHFDLARAAVDLHAVFDAVAAIVREPLRDKPVELLLDLQLPQEPLMGDATRLQQALLNYAANAARFTAAGRVVLRLRVEAETTQRACLRFEVEDSGAGIDEQTLARLFNAFEQADNTSTRVHGGTGLGLVITRRLARLMGGDAGARSEPGVGSCFWFTVWLDKGEGAGGAAPPAPSADAVTPARVLLVEDDPVNRTIASVLLQDLGHQVDLAEDGVQAVEMAQAGAYDLILMDMQMPRMDGLQATRLLRAMPQHARTPIVAITANAFDQDRQACMDAGMDDFVTKPIEHERLREGLRHWLRRPSA